VSNPFDPASVLLAKHAQHVVLVHFPIALTMTAIVFEWLALWKRGARSAALAEAAYWNLTGAAATSVATVATGIAAEPLALHLTPSGPPPSNWRFHCVVPASDWWNNIVFT